MQLLCSWQDFLELTQVCPVVLGKATSANIFESQLLNGGADAHSISRNWFWAKAQMSWSTKASKYRLAGTFLHTSEYPD